ncbi:hypothetical protein PFISCL1PPCAC_14035, partial [Pristionchus fissidentatus]
TNLLFLLVFIPAPWSSDVLGSPVKTSEAGSSGVKRTSGCYFLTRRYAEKERGKRLTHSISRAKCSEETVDSAPLAKVKEGDLHGAPNGGVSF